MDADDRQDSLDDLLGGVGNQVHDSHAAAAAAEQDNDEDDDEDDDNEDDDALSFDSKDRNADVMINGVSTSVTNRDVV